MRRHSQSLLQDLFYMGVQAGDRDTPVSAYVKRVEKCVLVCILIRGVTTDPGSILDCITIGRDWESHRVAHNLTQHHLG